MRRRRTSLTLTAAGAALALARARSARRRRPSCAQALPAARLQGEGRLRFFGLQVYDIRLWTPEPVHGRDLGRRSRWRWSWTTRAALTARRSPSARSTRCAARARWPTAQAEPWLAAMTRLFPDVQRRRPPHRRLPARCRCALLPQRPAARRVARPRLRAPLLRHLARPADLRAGAARPAARDRAMSAVSQAQAAVGWRGGVGEGLRYGALGLPLAFVALPLYVRAAQPLRQRLRRAAGHAGRAAARRAAARRGGRPLDRPRRGPRVRRPGAHPVAWMVAAALLLALGFRGLFFPPVTQGSGLLAWAAALLALTYLSYSVLSVLHQAWGARLGGEQAQRARIVSWREGLALVGVLVASVLPSLAGLGVATGGVRAAAGRGRRAAGACAPAADDHGDRAAALVDAAAHAGLPAPAAHLPGQRHRQRGAGHPGAVLRARPAAGAELGRRFPGQLLRGGRAVDAAVGARRGALGLARTWLAGMALAIGAFVWAATLGAGDGRPSCSSAWPAA